MNADIIQSVARAVLNVVAGILVAKGIATESAAEQLVGALATVSTLVWSMYHQNQLKNTAPK